MESQFSGERKFSGDWDNAMQIARIKYVEFEKRSSLTNVQLTSVCTLNTSKTVQILKGSKQSDVA